MTGRTDKTNKAMNVQTNKTIKAMTGRTMTMNKTMTGRTMTMNKTMTGRTKAMNKTMPGHINFTIDPSGASRPRKYFFDSGSINYFQPALRTSGAGLLPSSC